MLAETTCSTRTFFMRSEWNLVHEKISARDSMSERIPEKALGRLLLTIDLIRSRCLRPLLNTPSVDRLSESISEVLPSFTILYVEMCGILGGIVTGRIAKTMRHCDISGLLDPIFAVCPKAAKEVAAGFEKFFRASLGLLEQIESTSPDRLSHFEKRISWEVANKGLRTELLLLACLEGSRTDATGKIYLEIAKTFRRYANDYLGYVRSVLKEWDVITDIVAVESMLGHEKKVKDGRNPSAGTKRLKDLLDELGVEI